MSAGCCRTWTAGGRGVPGDTAMAIALPGLEGADDDGQVRGAMQEGDEDFLTRPRCQMPTSAAPATGVMTRSQAPWASPTGALSAP